MPVESSKNVSYGTCQGFRKGNQLEAEALAHSIFYFLLLFQYCVPFNSL